MKEMSLIILERRVGDIPEVVGLTLETLTIGIETP